MNDEAVYRTAPATPGLLNSILVWGTCLIVPKYKSQPFSNFLHLSKVFLLEASLCKQVFHSTALYVQGLVITRQKCTLDGPT